MAKKKVWSQNSNSENKKNRPVIILINPQLGQNIGMVARAMLNFGITELRVVNPRDGWPNDRAGVTSAGAEMILDNAQLFENTNDAISDLNGVFAATGRNRDMTKIAITPKDAAIEISKMTYSKYGVLFGNEANGLSNDDVALADKILMIPVNQEFSSLNLSHAVMVLAYEYFTIDLTDPPILQRPKNSAPVNKQEMLSLFHQLEGDLEKSGFFRITEKKAIMVRKIRNLIQRASPTEQEVRMIRGAISCLKRFKNN